MKNLLSRKALLLLAIIVFNVANALAQLVGGTIGDDIKEILTWAGLYHYRLYVTAALVLISLVVAAWIFIAEKEFSKDESRAEKVTEEEKARRKFLNDLAKRYKTRYKHKLDGRFEISLVVSDDLDNTNMQQFDEEFSADAHAGEAAQYIIERFEKQGRLLIVGREGSGKTLVLLTLAQYLAKKARADASQPLPVIFNLNSWSSEYKSFNDWIKDNLTKGYGLSPDFAGRLLTEQRIHFLLDGLDELARNEKDERAAEVRAGRLAELDDALHDGTMSVVICCRRVQFDAMLLHTGAEPPVAAVVEVKDLSAGQIKRALVKASETPKDRFAAPHLLAALEQEKDSKGVYHQVLSTPFYFTTALQVFDSTRRPHIDAPDRKTLEANLVTAFVEKKLKVLPSARRFPAAKTKAWLTWLATFLDTRVTFELADLQPSALRREWLYRVLFSVLIGVLASLITGSDGDIAASAFFGIFFALLGVYLVIEDSTKWTLQPLRSGRTWFNIIWQGLLVGLLFGVLFTVTYLRAGNKFEPTTERELAHPIINVVALILVLAFFGVVVAVVTSIVAIIIGAFVRLLASMLTGISGNVASSNIVTEDFAEWRLAPLRRVRTWREIFARGLFASVTAGLLGFGVSFIFTSIIVWTRTLPEYIAAGRVSVWLVSMMLFFTMLSSIVGGLIGAAIGLIANLLLGIVRACRQITRFASINSPYQRLMAALTFNILQGAVIGVSFVCLILVIMWLSYEKPTYLELYSAISAILAFGIFGLFRTPVLKHAVLRLCLAMEGALPVRYVDFLAYATKLRILENDGGQWRFRHQILQDHFAPRNQDDNSGLAHS